MKVNVKRLVFLFITIFTMCMIFYFSSQNADTSSNTSSGFAEIMAKILYPGFEKLSEAKRTDIINDCQFAVRKTAHFSIYGALGVFSCLTMNTYKNLKIWVRNAVSLGTCLCYSILDELHQYFIPGRSCELRDVCIDFCGAAVGTVIVMLIRYTVKKIKERINYEQRTV